MKNDDFCGIFRKRLQKIPFKQLTKAVFRVRIINAVMRKRGIPPFLRVFVLSSADNPGGQNDGTVSLLSLNCVRAISRNIFPNSYKEVAENAYH